MDDCIFCKISKGEIPSPKVFESKNFFVIKDIKPKSIGHSLVISKKHFESFLDMPKDLHEEFMNATKEAAEKILKEVGKKAFNLQMNNHREAGQEVPHAHLHIIPRG